MAWATYATAVLLVVAAAAQWRWSALLSLLERDAVRIRNGEIHRLLTTLWVQDGGRAGALFNIGVLLTVTPAMERALGRPMWLAAYFGGGVLVQLVGLAWRPVGGGNSVAFMSVAGAGFAQELLAPGVTPSRAAAAIGLAAGLALCALRDIHGAAVLIGSAIYAMG